MPTRNIQGTQVSRASVIILENNIWQYINANQECIKHSLLKELCHGYCACLHLTDANDVNKAMFI